MKMSVKAHFKSRYKDGVLIEADWVGMEVGIFAYLTQDTTLIRDITEGIDIHTTMYAKCFDVRYEDVTKDQRSGIKACTFHVIYGGGAKSMAIRMNLSEDFCKRFIQAFYDRYPMSKLWQDNLVRQVESTKYLIEEFTPKGRQKHEGYYRSITGRKYFFRTNDTPKFLEDRGTLTGFNPPEIKNYPVQGLATADVHMIALGHLFREAIKHRDKFLLVNTVHDSVLIDCRKEYIDFTCNLIRDELQSIKDIFKEKFKIEFNVPILVEVKYGPSWADMTKYEFNERNA